MPDQKDEQSSQHAAEHVQAGFLEGTVPSGDGGFAYFVHYGDHGAYRQRTRPRGSVPFLGEGRCRRAACQDAKQEVNGDMRRRAQREVED